MPNAKVSGKVFSYLSLLLNDESTGVEDRTVRPNVGRVLSRLNTIVSMEESFVQICVGRNGRDGGPDSVCEVDAR